MIFYKFIQNADTPTETMHSIFMKFGKNINKNILIIFYQKCYNKKVSTQLANR